MRVVVTIFSALVGLGLLSAWSGAHEEQDNARATGTTHVVKMITGNKFDPPEITVKVGDQVKWVNDNVSHTATADDQTNLTKSFNTGTVKKGQEAVINFNNAMTIPYHCEFHTGMNGKITVEP
jgi:plastocyanin